MARHQERRYPIGSISEGTMRPEDLIPEFLSELRYRMRERRIKGHAALYREIDKRSDAEGYYETEEADRDLEALFDALGEYAGPYFYFGAHPGDGADYGFWLSEGFDEERSGARITPGVPLLRFSSLALLSIRGARYAVRGDPCAY